MEIRLAESAGFCFGVQRAVDEAVREAQARKGAVYTFGPIVHNEIVTEELNALGVRVIGEDEVGKLGPGTVIIRAHGVPEKTEKLLRDSGMRVSDATCPFVKKIHRIAEKAGTEGRTVLILGDPAHPEVIGIMGHCTGPCYAVQTEEELEALELPDKTPLAVCAQTTFNFKKFEKLVEIIGHRFYNANIANTICNATKDRQAEAGRIASEADMMIVIGSRSSSNSQKLYDICSKKCNHTYFIQSVADLEEEWFKGVKCVGITAGASTPKKILKEVQKYARRF